MTQRMNGMQPFIRRSQDFDDDGEFVVSWWHQAPSSSNCVTQMLSNFDYGFSLAHTIHATKQTTQRLTRERKEKNENRGHLNVASDNVFMQIIDLV